MTLDTTAKALSIYIPLRKTLLLLNGSVDDPNKPTHLVDILLSSFNAQQNLFDAYTEPAVVREATNSFKGLGNFLFIKNTGLKHYVPHRMIKLI